jgi:hypothetical protein
MRHAPRSQAYRADHCARGRRFVHVRSPANHRWRLKSPRVEGVNAEVPVA